MRRHLVPVLAIAAGLPTLHLAMAPSAAAHMAPTCRQLEETFSILVDHNPTELTFKPGLHCTMVRFTDPTASTGGRAAGVEVRLNGRAILANNDYFLTAGSEVTVALDSAGPVRLEFQDTLGVEGPSRAYTTAFDIS